MCNLVCTFKAQYSEINDLLQMSHANTVNNSIINSSQELTIRKKCKGLTMKYVTLSGGGMNRDGEAWG